MQKSLNSYPTYLPVCLPACLPACLPPCLATYMSRAKESRRPRPLESKHRYDQDQSKKIKRQWRINMATCNLVKKCAILCNSPHNPKRHFNPPQQLAQEKTTITTSSLLKKKWKKKFVPLGMRHENHILLWEASGAVLLHHPSLLHAFCTLTIKTEAPLSFAQQLLLPAILPTQAKPTDPTTSSPLALYSCPNPTVSSTAIVSF